MEPMNGRCQSLRAIQARAAGPVFPKKHDMRYKVNGSANMADTALERAFCVPV